MSTQQIAKIAVLDTNALVRMFQLWELCRIANVSMSAVNDWTHLQRSLTSVAAFVPTVFRSADFELIKSGLSCFQRLMAAKSDYVFLCCDVSRAELHHVLLSAAAAEAFHRHRIPRSLANKRPLVIYQQVLSFGDYARVGKDISDFFGELNNDHGIDIKPLEDTGHGYTVLSDEVFATARIVWSHVLMETMDAYIVAAAIASDADCLVTADGPLQLTLNNLRNGQGEWRSVSQAMRTALNKPPSFAFPKGIGLSTILP